jgi:hypothetical protein
MSSEIDREAALAIAADDARAVYGDLDPYDVKIAFADGTWRVDYELRDPGVQGGGPHYVISAASGEILDRLYEQ